MRKGAQNLEGVGGRDEGFAFEHAAQRVDLRCRPTGQVGEGTFHDLAVAARGFTEEDGGRGVTVGDGLDVHGIMMA